MSGRTLWVLLRTVLRTRTAGDTFPHRLFPNYYQSLGLGFYEYFLLSEKIGAEPLPILSVGLACQYQNDDKDPNAHVAVKDLQSYIDDALDLIEFANGPVTLSGVSSVPIWVIRHHSI